MTKTMPEKVKVLSARNMCRDDSDGSRATHCLIGWQSEHFGDSSLIGLNEIGAECGFGISIIDFNDNPRNSKAKLASVWNRAMKLLGYVRKGKWFVKPKGRGK